MLCLIIFYALWDTYFQINLFSFYTFAHLKRQINDEKNKQKCKNLVITHRARLEEPCWQSQNVYEVSTTATKYFWSFTSVKYRFYYF